MALTNGDPQIKVGLIDGPVLKEHPDLSSATLLELGPRSQGSCTKNGSAACRHGTFVAGILSAKRGSPAPAICPGCTLLVRSIFLETTSGNADLPSTTTEELAQAIFECIEAGTWLINLSLAIAQPSSRTERQLVQVLDHALHRGVLVVAAAGNQGVIGSTSITRHPWVVPVIACDSRGHPIAQSNFGSSIGQRGLSAPGEAITSLGTSGQPITSSGTSFSAPFVTGTIALLWSRFPTATATTLRVALTFSGPQRRKSIIPPLLNAWAAYQHLASVHGTKSVL